MSVRRGGVRGPLVSASAVLLLMACDTSNIPPLRSGMSVSGPADSVLVGAGDIASCETDWDEATARLLDRIDGTVFTAGDNVYPEASLSNYRDCYGPTWGRHLERTRPAVGDHDDGDSYYEYFGAAAGEPGKGYYSFQQAGWLIVVLNSNIEMSVGSPQHSWLNQTLAADTAICQAAIIHWPRFSSGMKHGNAPETRALWDVFYRHGLDLVLSGHAHLYERYPLLDPDGEADPAGGIRQFVVGTGGRYLHARSPTLRPRPEVANAEAFGVLRLMLRPDSYAWNFFPAIRGGFTDAGYEFCH